MIWPKSLKFAVFAVDQLLLAAQLVEADGVVLLLALLQWVPAGQCLHSRHNLRLRPRGWVEKGVQPPSRSALHATEWQPGGRLHGRSLPQPIQRAVCPVPVGMHDLGAVLVAQLGARLIGGKPKRDVEMVPHRGGSS